MFTCATTNIQYDFVGKQMFILLNRIQITLSSNLNKHKYTQAGVVDSMSNGPQLTKQCYLILEHLLVNAKVAVAVEIVIGTKVECKHHYRLATNRHARTWWPLLSFLPLGLLEMLKFPFPS